MPKSTESDKLVWEEIEPCSHSKCDRLRGSGNEKIFLKNHLLIFLKRVDYNNQII